MNEFDPKVRGIINLAPKIMQVEAQSDTRGAGWSNCNGVVRFRSFDVAFRNTELNLACAEDYCFAAVRLLMCSVTTTSRHHADIYCEW